VYLIALSGTLVLTGMQLRRSLGEARPEAVAGERLLWFAAPMFVLMFTSAGLENLDLFVVKRVYGAEDVGVYGAVFTLARTISVVATPFQLLMLPLLAARYEEGRRLLGSFARLCLYFLGLAVVVVVVFGVWPEEVLGTLYGEPFVRGAPVLAPLSVGRLIAYLSGMIALLYASTGRFGILTVYGAGLVAQGIVLYYRHDTLVSVARAVLLVQGVLLVAMILYLVVDGVRRDAGGRPTEDRGAKSDG
jgi:O-antigen/teichoic acid export membrane protein